jgi:hypothetical protein
MEHMFRAEELPETCRVSRQNKFVKLVHLIWFYYKEICYDARSHERKMKKERIYLHYILLYFESLCW